MWSHTIRLLPCLLTLPAMMPSPPTPARDVMERMIKAGCAATSDFEWLSQLRFVFSREEGPFGICSVRQTNCQLEYSYEYQV